MVKKKKNPPAHARDVRDVGLIPRLGRSPGGGSGNPHLLHLLHVQVDFFFFLTTEPPGKPLKGD